jgi:MFS family permease
MDSYGPMRLAPVAAAILIPMYFALAECEKYWHFMLCLGILGGIGAAFGSLVAITSIGKIFARHRGLAMGIALSGASCGGVIFPLLLRSILIPLGWRWSFRIIGFIVAVFMGTGILCFLQCPRSRPSSVVPPRRTSKHTVVSFSAFRSAPFSFIAGGMFLLELAIFGISGLLPTFAATAGMPASTGFVLVAVLNSCSAVGRVLPGLASDRFGHFDIFLLMALVTAIFTGAIFVPFGSSSVGVLYGFAALWGFGSGSWLSIMPGESCYPRKSYFSDLCSVHKQDLRSGRVEDFTVLWHSWPVSLH